MSRSLSYGFLRNATKFLRQSSINSTINHPRHFLKIGSKVLIGSQICCVALKSEERTIINVEDSLRTACQEGDSAVILLMDKLKDYIFIVCKEYRNCLEKQIEITQIALNIGPLSEVWDELPQYRTLAANLNRELEDYMAVLNTIGQIAEDETFNNVVTENINNLKLIAIKYKELDNLVQKEFVRNKEIELQLLRVKKESILRGVN